MSRQIIAIDVDDVIADSTESVRLQVNKSLGSNLTREHYRAEAEYSRYYEQIWRDHGLEFSFDLLDSDMTKDQSHIPPIAGSREVIYQLSKKFDLAIVTSRDSEWEAATKAWLNQQFGDLFIGIYFTENNKTSQPRTKGQLCRKLGAQWLIDDNPEFCSSAIQEGVQGVLFGDYGWHLSVPEDATVCIDWFAVGGYFNERS